MIALFLPSLEWMISSVKVILLATFRVKSLKTTIALIDKHYLTMFNLVLYKPLYRIFQFPRVRSIKCQVYPFPAYHLKLTDLTIYKFLMDLCLFFFWPLFSPPMEWQRLAILQTIMFTFFCLYLNWPITSIMQFKLLFKFVYFI